MHGYLNLAENPLFIKHVRSRMRRTTILPNVVVISFFSLCIVFLDQTVKKNDEDIALGSNLFFWMQAMILLLMGGSQVATAVAHVKESGILDFHRVTPVPSRVQVLGFLLGAPIREWALFACTLPFALFCAIVGPWGVEGFTKVLLVQITGALLYHSIGIVTGLQGKSAKGASGRLVAIIVALNIASTNLSGQGVYGPALLSPLPVYLEVAFPKLVAERQQAQRVMRQQPGAWPAKPAPVGAKPVVDDPPFYGVGIPLVLQTLLFQSSIFAFLLIASGRRFHSSRLPLFSKPQALGFIGLLAFLSLGSVWQTSTITLTLSMAYFLTFASFWLVATVTPQLGDYMKGLQRSRRHGGAVTPWHDLASNKLPVLLFAGTILAALGLAFAAAPNFQLKGGGNFGNGRFEPWGPLVVAVLSVLSYGWSLQYFNLRYGKRAQAYFGLFLFLVWLVPVVVGLLLMAAGSQQAGIIMGASPFVGIFYAGGLALPMDPKVMLVVAIAPPAIMTFLFGALLLGEERRRFEQVRKEHEVVRGDEQAAA